MEQSGSLNTASPDQRFNRVCLPCRESKKKCDKLLPQCSRCQRFALDCIYDEPAEAPEGSVRTKLDEILLRLDKIEAQIKSGQKVGASAVTRESALENVASNESVGVYWERMNHKQLRPSYVRFFTIMNAFQVISDCGIPVVDVAEKYKLTTRKWLPVISQERLGSEIPRFNVIEASPGIVVLVLSMHLLNTHPSDLGGSVHESKLYITCKQLFSMSHSLGEVSVELAQAGVLISVFEYMQCIADRAVVTLGICASILTSLDGKTPSSLEDDVVRTWWTATIICRHIRTVPLKDCKCLRDREGLVRLEKLRTTAQHAHAFDNYQSHSSQDYRYLLKEAEAIHTASQLEEMVRSISDGVEMHGNAGLEIESIISMITSRLNGAFESTSIDNFHAGLWTSLSSLLIFRSFCFREARSKSDRDSYAVQSASLREAIRTTETAVNRFQTVAVAADSVLDSVPPSLLTTIFQAAMAQMLLDERCPSVATFLNLLKVFRARWKMAERYLEILNSAPSCDDHSILGY